MMKKLVALLMALAMLCSSIAAFADPVDPVTPPETPSTHVHNYVNTGAYENGTAPTCEAGAREIWKCTVEDCDQLYDLRPVGKLGHDFSVEGEITLEPTPISTGKQTMHCSRTGCTETSERTLDMTGAQPTEDYDTPINLVEEDLELGCKPHTLAFENTDAAKAATCTEEGKRYFLCAECGNYFDIVLPALGHEDPTDPTKVQTEVKPGNEPSCTKTGLKTHKFCGRCNKAVEWDTVMDMVPHAYGEYETVDATCTTPEKQVRTCAVCNDVDEIVKEDSELGHTWEREGYNGDEHVHVFETATCTKDGKKGAALVCDECGEVKDMSTAQVVPMLDHLQYMKDNADEIYTVKKDGTIVVAKWIKEGENDIAPIPVGECLATDPDHDCDANPEDCVYQAVYGALKINYVKPTCLVAGSLTATCVECGKSLSVELPATGHDYEPVWETDAEEEGLVKDCTKASSLLYECTNCHDRYNQAIEPAKEHTLNIWDGEIRNEVLYYTQQKAADSKPVKYAEKDLAHCISYDVHYKCAVWFCEEEIVVTVDPTEKHDANGKYAINEEPTCTTDGRKLYNCAKCGKSQDEKRDHLGHDFVVADDDEVKLPATCTEPGVRLMKCSRCDATEEGPIPALGHHYVLTKSVPADCTAKPKIVGKDTYTCTICKDTYDVITGDGHEKGKQEAHTDATCTKDGVDQFWCAKCHELVSITLPATGHSFEYSGNDKENEKIGEEAFQAEHNELCDGSTKGCTPATCKNGAAHGDLHVVKCTDCDATSEWEDKETLPAGHNMYVVEKDGGKKLNHFVLNTDKLPTCEVAGEAYYRCTLCKEIQPLVLEPISHNWELSFDDETGTWNMVCKPLKNDSNAKARLIELMKNAGYDDMVAKAVADQLCKTNDEFIKGIGCEKVDKIVVHEPKFEISKISSKFGQVKLVEDTWPPKDPVYVRLAWNYTQGNGDTICFVTLAEIEWDYENEEEVVGTFRCSGLQMPDGWDCNFCRVDVVSDPDADDLFPGQYKDYGYDYI